MTRGCRNESGSSELSGGLACRVRGRADDPRCVRRGPDLTRRERAGDAGRRMSRRFSGRDETRSSCAWVESPGARLESESDRDVGVPVQSPYVRCIGLASSERSEGQVRAKEREPAATASSRSPSAHTLALHLKKTWGRRPSRVAVLALAPADHSAACRPPPLPLPNVSPDPRARARARARK